MVSQLTSSPQTPKTVNESSELTLVWKYNIAGPIIVARFRNITGGRNDRIVRKVGVGDTMVELEYRDRIQANITDSEAWLKILQVQRSDKGMYVFDLEPTQGGSIGSDLELIVQCKCLSWLIHVQSALLLVVMQ